MSRTAEWSRRHSRSAQTSRTMRLPCRPFSDHLTDETARQATGREGVFVGRIREDLGSPNGLACWVVGDNLRKGAATHAVDITELLLKKI